MDTIFKHSKRTDVDEVKIVGPINEESEIQLTSLTEILGEKIVIDFSEVTSVNSLGVRAWINFMRNISSKTVSFEKCVPEIVNQINMIPSFRGKAKVESVYGDFSCNKCKTELKHLFLTAEIAKNDDDEIEIPSVSCPKCKSSDMEFEEIEDTYFAFLNS